MDSTAAYRFDPVDLEQVRLLGRLPPARRIRAMLDARDLAVGLMRGRLRRQYPHLAPGEISLKLLEELEREGTFDEAYVDVEAQALGADVAALWEAVKKAARREAGRAQAP